MALLRPLMAKVHATALGEQSNVLQQGSLASLQATTANHILAPANMFSWSRKHINGTHVFYTSAEDVVNRDKKFDLGHRYARLKTLPLAQDPNIVLNLHLTQPNKCTDSQLMTF